MNEFQTAVINASEKTLIILAANLGNTGEINALESLTQPFFVELSSYYKYARSLLVFRDGVIDGIAPGGRTITDNESLISVRGWPTEETQLRDAIAHELHHQARFQTIGFHFTLGEVIAAEGLAAFYAFTKTQYDTPWLHEEISPEVKEKAHALWINPDFDHREWFFEGEMGKWTGYRLGYHLAKQYFQDGFSLERSVRVRPEDLKALL